MYVYFTGNTISLMKNICQGGNFMFKVVRL